jgi:hypothetical protein
MAIRESPEADSFCFRAFVLMDAGTNHQFLPLSAQLPVNPQCPYLHGEMGGLVISP